MSDSRAVLEMWMFFPQSQCLQGMVVILASNATVTVSSQCVYLYEGDALWALGIANKLAADIWNVD